MEKPLTSSRPLTPGTSPTTAARLPLIANYTYDGSGRHITSTASGTRADTYFSGNQDIQLRRGVTTSSNGTANSTYKSVAAAAAAARIARPIAGRAVAVYADPASLR